MADNIFDRNYAAATSAKADPKSAIETLARQTGVPVNILIAAGEAAGAKDAADAVDFATRAAKELQATMAQGATMEDAVTQLTGDPKVTSDFLARAKQIGAELYPVPQDGGTGEGAPSEANAARDMAAGAGGALVRGVGGLVQYGGDLVDRAADVVVGAPYRAVTGSDAQVNVVRPWTDAIGGGIKAGGQAISSLVSDEAKQAAQASMPSGNIMDPSTWKAPEDVTVRGVLQVAAEGLGSMGPVILAALVSKNPAAVSTIVGGGMAGGDGRDTAAQIVDAMWQARDANGVSELEKDSDDFRLMVEKGATPEQAYAELRTRAMNMAGDFQAVVGGAGGGVTGALISKGLPQALAGKSFAGNIARGIVTGALEEGTQEAIETGAARTGVNIGAGTNIDVGEGTLDAFAQGALAGGPVGVLAGRPPEKPAGKLREALNKGAPVAPPAPRAPAAPAGAAPVAPEPAAAKGAMGEAAAAAPTPPAFAKGAVYDVEIDGGDPLRLTFDSANPMASTFVTEDGEVVEIPAAELGTLRITPVSPDQPAPLVQEGKKPAPPTIQEVVDPLDGQEMPPPQERVEMSDAAADALDHFEAGTQAIQKAEGLSPEEAAAKAAKLTIDYIDRLAVEQDPDVKELVGVLSERMQYKAPKAAAPAPAQAETPAPKAEAPAAPTAPVAPAAAAQDEDAPAWEAMSQDERADAVKRAGYVTAKGNVSGPGEKLAASTWTNLPDAAKAKVKAVMAAPQAESVPDAAPTAEPAPAAEPVRKAPSAEDFPELNEIETGGQFGRKRAYPGFVIAKTPTGFAAYRATESTPIISAGSLEDVKRGMINFRNPFTGEAFKYEAAPKAAPTTEAKPAPDAEAAPETVSDKSLPGRLPQGVPLANIRVTKNPNGTYARSFSMATASGGSSSPLKGEFASISEAESDARLEIQSRAQARLVDLPNGLPSSDTDKSDARKILKWLGVDPIETDDEAEPQAQAAPVEAAPAAPQPKPQAAEGDPLRAALRAGMAGGVVEHVTKKGKTLRGYIVKNMKADDVKTVDQYAFRKGDGMFVREEAANTFFEDDAPAAPSIMDARKEETKRKTRELGKKAALENEPRTAPEWMQGDAELSDLWLEGYGEGIAERAQAPADGTLTVTQPRTGNTMTIDPLGPLREGYERVVVDGKPSTDSFRETEDGYIIKRNVTKTTILGPQGNVIYTGSYAVDEAVVDKEIATARMRREADALVDAGMKRGEGEENAWFRNQRDMQAKGTAVYKARAIFDAGKSAYRWKLTRDFRPEGGLTAPPTRDMGMVDTVAEALAQLRENGMRTGQITDDGQVTVDPAPQPAKQAVPAEKPVSAAAPEAKPATGILSVLSEDKQKRADELKAKLAAKARNQISSGVDPEYLTLGGELVALYIEAGAKRFGQMLRDFAESTGLTMREAQVPMRVAYNYVRDEMDLNGEDVSDMDTADQVMAEIRKAIAEDTAAQTPSQDAPESGMQEEPAQENGTNELPAGSQGAGAVGEGREREDGGRQPLESGQPDGNRNEGDVAGEQASPVQSNAGTGRSGRTRARNPVADDRAGEADGAGGLEPVGRPDGGVPRTDDAGRLTPKARSNYVIADPEALFGGTPKRRFAKNRAAIEAFQRVTDESREPTQEELDDMASYIGWGSFGQNLFQGTWERPIYQDGWRDENDWLRAHLGKDNWQAAQNSIINAHYTDPPTVQAMWRMAEQMGFKGGRILEPSMGIGNFFGMIPPQIAQNSDLTGIELDRLTGGMAKLLYPRANVQIMGYEQNKTPDNFYDLVIGNWPFADFQVPDRRYMRLSPNLHDYFFVKALDQVRPGGLVMGITSAGTMDKQGRVIRNHLAKNAELVASFRLPSGAFEKYAGTSVVTDLIILRKREAPILDVSDAGWTQTATIETPAGTEIRVNEYYANDRAKVLGTLNFGSGSTYGRPSMIVDRPVDLMDRLNALHEQLPTDAYQPVVRGNEPRFVANNTTDPQKSVVERDGVLYQVQGDRLVRLEDVAKYKVKDAKKTAEREAQFRGLIDLRKKLGAVLDADRDGLADADAKRAALKKAYQAFVKTHGRIRDTFAIDLMSRALGDPGAAKVKALETRDGKPAAIMDKATTRAVRSLEKPTIADAFILARNETTNLNLDRIAELANAPRDEAIARLLESKAIYRTPGGGFEASDVYLSGNVRQKLKDAVAAKEAGEDLSESINALKSVIPTDVPYFNIEAKLGAMWIPSDVYRGYIGQRFGLPESAQDAVSIRYSAGAWRVEFPKGFDGRAEVQAITGGDLRPKQFISYALNNQTITIRRRDVDGNEYKDEAATERANQLASELRQNFSEWVWQDPERRSNLETAYNDAMNAIATPSYDGSFMDFAGMAITRGDQPFNLRSHQSNAIWRGVLNGRGIFAHEVGTGKTITMAGLAVESRRYGVARKPLIIAHNANSKSVFNEIQETYPGGKFLYVDNLAPAEIAETLNMIATDDWDGIVIPHSLIDRMALKEETLMAMAAEEIAQYEQEALAAAQEDDASLTLEMMDDEEAIKKLRSVTAKQLVKARNQIIAKIKKQALQASKEGAVTFEELGVDMIVVDEAHEFKKPPVATRMTVRGLQKQVSSRSLQLRFLTDYVKGQRGGKGVHVFTGTPITNTLTEIYHQMRYVMDDVMRQSDVNEWDGFFNTFAASVPDVELTAAGDYESVERLSSFVNVAELRRMAGQYMDIVFADDMPEFKPRAAKSGKTADAKDLSDGERDELLNGRTESPIGRPYKKVIHDIAEMDPAQRRILDEVVGHARAFRAAKGKERMAIMREGGPNAPIVFNNVPTRAGLDVRLHDIEAPDSEVSKASRIVRNVSRIYNEDARTTQVIFMDEGYSDTSTKAVKNSDGEKVGTERIARFNLAKDIRDRLTAEGIPADQIAIVDGPVSKDKRAEIARKMNNLEIRVVIGQTQTLGVGVNMQENLRAMHHADAPWMPGDLEQRNGRGHRQGNKWNTVLEYRYLTEGLDGRRWQVLSIKDRFIKAFLKADANLRVIEGDATDDATSMGADDLAQTLSEAAGDPRIFQAKKLEKDIDRLQRRERIHGEGIANAKRSIRMLEARVPESRKVIDQLRRDQAKFEAAREAGFTATIGGRSFDDRAEAQEAFDAVVMRMKTTDRDRFGYQSFIDIGVSVQGFPIKAKRASYDEFHFAIDHEGWSGYDTLGKPSIASVEAGLRRFADRIEGREGEVAQNEASIARLQIAVQQPFQQANILTSKQAQLTELQADMRANPVAPPSWLRQGAPIDALIYVDGEPRAVLGHRWTDEGWFVLTEEGPVDYTDAQDEAGLPIYDEREFQPPQVNEGSRLRTGEETENDARESRMPANPVGTLTGDELGAWSELPQLRRKAEKWYRENLGGQTVTNAGTGWEITFANSGGKKTTSGKGEDLLRIVPALRSIVESGTLIATSPDNKSRSGIEAVHTFRAAVDLAGVVRDVIVQVRQSTDGKYYYNLSRDMSDGARFLLREGDVTSEGMAANGQRPLPALEGNPDDLNLAFAAPNINPRMSFEAMRAVADRLSAELERSGLAGKVRGRLVRALADEAGVEIQGRQRGNVIEVNPDAPVGAVGVLRHEIVHALRDADLWGKPYGLFSQEEWRGLVAEARKRSDIRRRVEQDYRGKNLSESQILEEMVAETYREWAETRDAQGAIGRTMGKIRGFLLAVANALRGEGFQSAGTTFERMANGTVGGRGPDGGGNGRDRAAASPASANPSELRMPSMPFARNEEAFDKNERKAVSSLLTDAMGGASEKYNLLGLVPGRALFAELGKNLPGARRYLRLKEQMDTLRSEWHSKTDEVANRWREALSKDGEGNKAMMDLMHDATRAGVDPARRFIAPTKRPTESKAEHAARVGKLESAYVDLKPRWDALPEAFKKLYVEVRETYREQADAFEQTLIDNVRKAMGINVKRAQRAYEAEMERIRDEGITGDEKTKAIDTAKKKLATAERKAEWGINARISQLRLQFESNRLDGPYFPLMRYGKYFVTVRDSEGKVVSFSRFESERKQRAYAKEMQQDPDVSVDMGVMKDNELREQVDPNFVAEVESIIGDKIGDSEVMDMVWQRWLETMPDFSVRKSKIHRKGTPGYSGDAFRAFGKQVFHGGHQLARLKYGMDMQDALDDARAEAAASSDPNRNGLIVNEMGRRHQFAMNPTGSAIAQALTSAAFVYYLGITPAAAIVNLTQTTVVGIPMLAAGFPKGTVSRAARETTRAMADFVAGRADATRGPRVTDEEARALQEAYNRGTIDKSEAHDLAGVAESGVEYSNLRMRIMKPISFLFHHTERMNREVTYLAAYRMARSYGMDHADAIDKAADLTWKTHFDYQNTSRPRLMQNDTAKVLLVFRNYQINLLWRLFRDMHQITKGKSVEERREARTQLLGITSMMMLHAGITGTWGYALLMMLAGVFFPGGSDDAEDELKRAMVETFGPGAAGLLLKGVPGHLTGLDLTNRIGMPELWFRSSDRQLEGDDEYHYFMEQMLGAVPAMGQNVWRGMQQIGEGNVWRGVETMSPKFFRDLMKGYRYAEEGVTTYKGDQIFGQVSVGDAFMQALGFSPAQVAERYEANTRLKNAEKRIVGDRQDLHRRATSDMREGGITQDTFEAIRDYNMANPSYPITPESIKKSAKSRQRAEMETDGGIRLNPKLDTPLRLKAPPALYD